MVKFIPSGRDNSCPVCANSTEKCRQSASDPNYWLCMAHADSRVGEIINGFKCLGQAKNGLWAQFKPNNTEDWVEGQRQEKRSTPLNEAKELEDRKQRSLPIEKRDLLNRQIADELPLHPDDLADLKRRGLNDEQIQRLGAKSVEPYQRLSAEFDLLLPGIGATRRNLTNGRAGYLVPARDPDGLIAGYQIRKREVSEGEGRYCLLSNEKQSIHLYPKGCQSGEIPLAAVRPSEIKADYYGLTEGFLKAFIASEKLGVPIIGASGGLFQASKNLFKAYLRRLGAKPGDRVVLFPDAGSAGNKNICDQYKNALTLVSKLGCKPTIGWWEQIEKTSSDIDELGDLSRIEFIEPEEFFALAREQQKKRKVEEKKAKTVPKPLSKKEQKELEEAAKLNAIEELYRSLSEIHEVPWKTINTPLLDVESLGLEPGSVYVIRSPMGTGKTQALKPLLRSNPATYGWFSRVALGRAEGAELGIPFRGDKTKSNKWFFCSNSSYQFDPEFIGKEGLLILDECDQVFDHNFGSTCNADGVRPLILASLEAQIKSVVTGGGIVIAASADVSQKEVDYLRALAPSNCPVRVIVNEYRPPRGRVVFDESKTSDAQIELLLSQLEKGVPCFVLDDFKNGVRGCKNLAEYIRSVHPEWSDKIVEINSDSSGSPEVIRFLENINTASQDTLLICCSPSVVSGISITNQRFVNGVFAFLNGVLTVSEAMQGLGRVRGAKTTYVWAAKKGLVFYGNRATHPQELKGWMLRNYTAQAKHILSFRADYNPMTHEFSSASTISDAPLAIVSTSCPCSISRALILCR